jgi:hypothetical protein
MLKWIFGRPPGFSALKDGFATVRVEDSARGKTIRSCFDSRLGWEERISIQVCGCTASKGGREAHSKTRQVITH